MRKAKGNIINMFLQKHNSIVDCYVKTKDIQESRRKVGLALLLYLHFVSSSCLDSDLFNTFLNYGKRTAKTQQNQIP